MSEKPSVPKIVDSMLMECKWTRRQIMDEVRRRRPDFKDPSAAVSNGLRRLAHAGTHGAIVEGRRARKPRPDAPRFTEDSDGNLIRRRLTRAEADARHARFRAKLAETTRQVADGFRRAAEFTAQPAPRLKRIWPA